MVSGVKGGPQGRRPKGDAVAPWRPEERPRTLSGRKKDSPAGLITKTDLSTLSGEPRRDSPSAEGCGFCLRGDVVAGFVTVARACDLVYAGGDFL